MLSGSALATALLPRVAYADDDDDDYASKYNEDGVLIGIDQLKAEVEMQTIALDSTASFTLPKFWKTNGKGGWDDPVNGPQVEGVALYTADFSGADITALGKLNKLDVGALPAIPKDLLSGDLVGAKKETRAGQIFYDFDLALSPKICPQSQQLIQGLCFPDTVVLLSATVLNGKIYVIDVRANEAQWKAGSKALRSIRGSFKVA